MTDSPPLPDAPEPPPNPPQRPLDERQLDESGNSLWVRLLYMILFAALSYAVLWIYLALTLLQFIVFVVAGKPNEELRGFMRKLLNYVASIFGFLGFLSDTKPFPFSSFADGSPKPDL